MSPTAYRYVPAIMGTIMSFLMTGVVTAWNLGIGADLALNWASAWSLTLPLAVISAYLAAPIARRVSVRIDRVVAGPADAV